MLPLSLFEERSTLDQWYCRLRLIAVDCEKMHAFEHHAVLVSVVMFVNMHACLQTHMHVYAHIQTYVMISFLTGGHVESWYSVVCVIVWISAI